MSRTDWGQMVYDKQLTTAKSNHKKLFVSQKILTVNLPEYVDDGWEKSRDYKGGKFIGITKEKNISEQFEDRIWLLLRNCNCFL